MKDHIIRSSFRFLLLFSAFFMANNCSGQGTVSATYTSGSIPTSYQAFDSTCNGNNIVLQLAMPSGESYLVTGLDISYSMTATGGGTIGQQRSQVKCINTQITEPEASYILKSPGTWHYSRQNVNIANGTYAGGTVLSFEMHAWRTGGTPGCNTLANRVDNNTWTITLHYSAEVKLPKTGINDANPLSTLDVNGKIKMGDDLIAPQAGMMRWNSVSQDFEGYNGTQWLSLMYKGQNGGWGNSIVYENAGVISGNEEKEFGQSISASGDFALVGAPEEGVMANTKQGMTYVYKRNGKNWEPLLPTLVVPDGETNDFFGFSVSVSGDYAIIGAHGKDVAGKIDQGKAYIFKRSGDTWLQESELLASDGAALDHFGRSVCISGDYAIVGASEKNVGANVDQGKAYLFIRNGTTWTEQAGLVASDGSALDLFGVVSISGNYAIVSAVGKDVNGKTNQGKAYIFAREGTTWVQQAELLASDGTTNDYFQNVSIAGNYAIVGAFQKDIGFSSNQGKAYIYERSGSTWTERAAIVASDGFGADNFGRDVSISGDFAIIGAPNKNNQKGKAYIFKKDGNTWTEQTGLIASDAEVGDNFGGRVFITANMVMVAAKEKDLPGALNAGKIYFFTK